MLFRLMNKVRVVLSSNSPVFIDHPVSPATALLCFLPSSRPSHEIYGVADLHLPEGHIEHKVIVRELDKFAVLEYHSKSIGRCAPF